jgi:tetratricopeptide (TPR) repeat protein
MDLISTPPASSNPVEDGSAGLSLRQMWQVPVFFLGVVAIITACLTRPYIQPDPVRQLHYELNEARRLLHRHTGDPDGALQHAQHAVENIMYDPSREAEAFFLLGSAHLLVAETTEEADSGEHWREARQNLEEAERRNLAGDDAGRLHYRLAKVFFHTKEDPKHVIALLKANKDQADDRAECLSLLTQTYMRLNPPDLKAALAANEELRQKVPQVGEEVLGPAKLAGAKLLLRLNRTDEARKTLEKINDQAPPDIRMEAHMRLAALYQEENKWSEAAELWKSVLEEKRVPLTDPGRVHYNLGICCRHLDQLPRAAEAWTECLRHSHGEEAQAAALALADLRLHDNDSGKAVEMLAQAVAKVRKSDDWKNALMDLPRVQDLFERAVQEYRQADQFDLAVQTAELYERVAIAPKAQLLRADLSTEWARMRREHGRLAKDASTRNKDETTARELFRQAAEAHTEAAKLVSGQADKDEHQWLSAVCSFDGEEYARAAEKLTKILEGEMDNIDRQSEGWFLLGETHRHLKHADAAQSAYLKCVENNARFTCRARYQLAMIAIEAGKIDQAAQDLEQNLKLEHPDFDAEAQEKSRFALCSLLYHGGAKLAQNYRRVVGYLEGTLERVSLTPEAVRARFQLADSYRQLAAQRTFNHFMSEHHMSEKMSPEAHEHFLEENRRSLTRAAEEFAKLEEMLKDPELSSLLTVKQRKEVPYIVAQCRFNLGEYEKALRQYEELAAKCKNTPEVLLGLGGTVQCYGAMEDYDRLHKRAEEIRKLLGTIEGLSAEEKQLWQDWLNRVSKVQPRAKRSEAGRPERQPPSEHHSLSKMKLP